MDFDDNFEELEKHATLEENFEEETGFGLSDQELKELEKSSDAVIFAIDCRNSMMMKNQYNEDNLSNFETVIKAAIGFLKSKIISSEMDQTGIILYNWDKSQNSFNFESVYILDKLDRPNAETIKSLDTLIDSKEIRFKNSKSETPLSDLLWTWQQQFKIIDKSTFTKRIFLFTNEEDPMNEIPKSIEEAIDRAKSLREDDIDIELFPMPHSQENKKEFDVKLFFSNILTIDDDELWELKDYESAYFRVQDLSKRIRQKEFKKRVQGKWLFSISPSMNVGLKFFNLIKKTMKPNAKHLNKNSK